MTEYDPGQIAAGFRSMCMLAALVRRGGRPAPVAATIPLRLAEKQYAWFPVTTGPAGRPQRRVAVITDRRLLVGAEEISLRSIVQVRPGPDWDLTLVVRGRATPLTVQGPWVPWLSVVICAELYGAAYPPMPLIPLQRLGTPSEQFA